jgi:hypothetical protein
MEEYNEIQFPELLDERDKFFQKYKSCKFRIYTAQAWTGDKPSSGYVEGENIRFDEKESDCVIFDIIQGYRFISRISDIKVLEVIATTESKE